MASPQNLPRNGLTARENRARQSGVPVSGFLSISIMDKAEEWIGKDLAESQDLFVAKAGIDSRVGKWAGTINLTDVVPKLLVLSGFAAIRHVPGSER